MTNPNSVIGQLLTTTLDNYKNTITDNIENFHPLLAKMKANGNIIKESGGLFLHVLSSACFTST